MGGGLEGEGRQVDIQSPAWYLTAGDARLDTVGSGGTGSCVSPDIPGSGGELVESLVLLINSPSRSSCRVVRTTCDVCRLTLV